MRRHRARHFAASAVAVAALAGVVTPAAADRVYHSAHLKLSPVGDAPLRSGFVENIKAQGPRVYAHEIFVLNGARRNATYTVVRNFFFLDPACGGAPFTSVVALLETNRAGNARADIFVRPAEVAGFEGVHGVLWTVENPRGNVLYRTGCSIVTLD